MKKKSIGILFLAWVGTLPADVPFTPTARHDGDGRISVLFAQEVGAIFHAGDTLPRHTINPFVAPGGTALTRAFPFRSDVPDEPHDHPHHTGVWLAHGSVNGTDYWTCRLSKEPTFPRIVSRAAPTIESISNAVRITSLSSWQPAAGKIDLEEVTSLTFSQPNADYRILDWDSTLTARQDTVIIGDTKEGFMALRVATFLNVKGKNATGSMFDSEGRKDGAVWGNPAKWVVYTGTSEGQKYAVGLIDHPENPRHPTHWHARDYGLAAANPFGLHDFKKGPKKAGEARLSNGESLRFRYRILAMRGTPSPEMMDKMFRDFGGTEK